jgi:hypothetical protein
MQKGIRNCTACNTHNICVLTESNLLVCKNCHAIVFANVAGYDAPKPALVPDDWSFIQIGTSAEYQKQILNVVGRIRLQLRNDYKNFWCCALDNGSHIWLMESFASFAILSSSWHVYNGETRTLQADLSISVSKGVKLVGEYVERCEGISYEGEIGNWKLFYASFFFIQGSNSTNDTAVFTAETGKGIQFLAGKKVEMEDLNLKNILTWDEWK